MIDRLRRSGMLVLDPCRVESDSLSPLDKNPPDKHGPNRNGVQRRDKQGKFGKAKHERKDRERDRYREKME